jgi:hypothetical protein
MVPTATLRGQVGRKMITYESSPTGLLCFRMGCGAPSKGPSTIPPDPQGSIVKQALWTWPMLIRHIY